MERCQHLGMVPTAFKGTVLNAEAVLRAVEGHAAVLSTLGPRADSEPDLCSRGTRNIIDAMKTHGVRRLVQVTGAMIGHPHDRLGLVYRMIAAAVGEPSLRDRRLQEQLVIESGLEWTLIRPTRLTDGAPKGQWRDGEHERIGAFAHIARADVAEAMLRALENRATIGHALTLQY